MTKVNGRKIKSLKDKLVLRLSDSYRMLHSMKVVLNGLIEMHNNLHRNKTSHHTLDAFGCSAYCIEEWEHKIERQENHCRRSVDMINDKLEVDNDYVDMLISQAIVKSKHRLGLAENYIFN
jgi:hypothetical protein